MSKKLKKLFKGCVILAPFLFILLDIYRLGLNLDNVESVLEMYTTMIQTSALSDLFMLFTSVLGVNAFGIVIFVVFLGLIYTDFVIIIYDLLMFIPHFVGKMLDKVGKVGVKDE